MREAAVVFNCASYSLFIYFSSSIFILSHSLSKQTLTPLTRYLLACCNGTSENSTRTQGHSRQIPPNVHINLISIYQTKRLIGLLTNNPLSLGVSHNQVIAVFDPNSPFKREKKHSTKKFRFGISFIFQKLGLSFWLLSQINRPTVFFCLVFSVSGLLPNSSFYFGFWGVKKTVL